VVLDILHGIDLRNTGHKAAAMQVKDTAEWLSGRLYCSVMILRICAIDYIAIQSVDDDDDDDDDDVSILHNAA
jgi:hypothetical protein